MQYNLICIVVPFNTVPYPFLGHLEYLAVSPNLLPTLVVSQQFRLNV